MTTAISTGRHAGIPPVMAADADPLPAVDVDLRFDILYRESVRDTDAWELLGATPGSNGKAADPAPVAEAEPAPETEQPEQEAPEGAPA